MKHLKGYAFSWQFRLALWAPGVATSLCKFKTNIISTQDHAVNTKYHELYMYLAHCAHYALDPLVDCGLQCDGSQTEINAPNKCL